MFKRPDLDDLDYCMLTLQLADNLLETSLSLGPSVKEPHEVTTSSLNTVVCNHLQQPPQVWVNSIDNGISHF